MNDREEEKAERKKAGNTDRSKYKKTDREKHQRREREALEEKLSKKNLRQGRVLAIRAGEILLDADGKEFSCVLSGLLKKEISRAKNIVTVGDFVQFEEEKGLIVQVLPRRSILSRREHLHRHQEQLIAANIDQVLITVSVVSPPLKPALVDRYIIATLKGGMKPVIVVNKIDLLEDEAQLREFITTYEDVGIPVIPLSATTGKGMERLVAQMTGKASVFSGQSGTGKSSLINAVTGLKLSTGELAKKTSKGTHTTTSTHLIPLSCGGWCIDTPGIRSFGLWDLRREDLLHYFPEITEIGGGCRFPNCTHSHEPGCAVKAAVENEEISFLRWESFQKLRTEVID